MAPARAAADVPLPPLGLHHQAELCRRHHGLPTAESPPLPTASPDGIVTKCDSAPGGPFLACAHLRSSRYHRASATDGRPPFGAHEAHTTNRKPVPRAGARRGGLSRSTSCDGRNSKLPSPPEGSEDRSNCAEPECRRADAAGETAPRTDALRKPLPAARVYSPVRDSRQTKWPSPRREGHQVDW